MTSNQQKCAFHPTETIVNFCRSPGCFLPMCPTCIKIHSEEHRLESTYGEFENINTVVGEIQYNISSLDKLLQGMTDDFRDVFDGKNRIETDLRKKITEAKGKIIQQIERYFYDIEASLSKSITNYKDNTTEQFVLVDKDIIELRRVLKTNLDNLSTERALKTVITYHIDDYLAGWKADVKKIEARINDVRDQSANIVIDENIITQVMDRLDQYLTISYQGYCEKGFYAKQYSKSKIGSTSRVGTINGDRN